MRNSQEQSGVGHAYTDTQAVIVGGGIAGMCAAIKLIEAGIQRITIIEKSSGFGGTWRDNRYPGCRCDIPAHLYCFSFTGNPDWSRVFPDQTEILAYLTKVAAEYQLHNYVRFSSEVEGAEWDESRRRWKVSVRVLGGKDAEYGSKYIIESDFLISCVGQLNVPYIPDLPGLQDFKGKIVHSARWNLSEDLRGKRVGIIGNGATAIQIVPELAPVTSQLTLFQRTPNWVMPRDDEAYPSTTRKILQYVPLARSFYRAGLMARSEGFHQPLTGMGTAASEELHKWCLGLMHSQLPGREDLWKLLTPKYAPGCKRILISNDFYPALLRETVKIETSAIQSITEKGILTVDSRETVFDYIILATGFQTNDFLQSLPIKGRNGRTLQNVWQKNGAQALYGIGAEEMPNFAMLYGPNTNLAHNSIILMIEAQARYIAVLVTTIVKAREQGRTLMVVPKTSRIAEYNGEIQRNLDKTSFADPRCQSWYKTEEGRVLNNWWGTVVQYQELLSEVRWSDFDVTVTGGKKSLSGQVRIGRVVEEMAWKSRIVGLGTVVVGGVLSVAIALICGSGGNRIFSL